MRAATPMAEQWETHGFIPSVDVLSGAEVPGYRAAFDDLERRSGRDRAEIKLIDRHFDLELPATRGSIRDVRWLRPMTAVPQWRLLVVLLVSALIALTPLAHAAPPDPTWIGGFYDDADYDDAVLAITSTAGVSDVAALRLVAPIPVVVGIVSPAIPGDLVVAPPPASQIRAPPAS